MYGRAWGKEEEISQEKVRRIPLLF